jgi:hypothetical protein
MRGEANDMSKDRKYWASDKRAAELRLSGLGGRLVDSSHAYEMWRWEHPELTLIFYPHKTSANNYHCRVRAGRCMNRETLRQAIFALAENSCTFQFPTERELHNEGVMAAIRREREAVESRAAALKRAAQRTTGDPQ